MAEPQLVDRIMLAPSYVFSIWKPDHTITWAIKGILHFTVAICWLLLTIVPVICIEAITIVLASYQNYKRRQEMKP